MLRPRLGYQLKQTIIRRLSNLGYEVKDFGTDSEASCDYPDYAHPCAKAIESGDASFGVAMCGSGNGIAMTLNKHQSIRAAICWSPELAMTGTRPQQCQRARTSGTLH